MRASKLRKFLFLACLIFSVGIHGSFLFLFFKTPFAFRQKLSGLWSKSTEKPDLLLTSSKEKLPGNVNAVLEESFSHLVAINAQRPKIRELQDDEIAEKEADEEIASN